MTPANPTSRLARRAGALSAAGLLAFGLLAATPVFAQDAPAPAETPAAEPAPAAEPPAAGPAPVGQPAAPAAAPAAEPAAPAAPQPTDVVATLNGEPITEADLAAIAQDFGREVANLPEDQRRASLIDAVIDMRLMVKAAEEAGLDQSETFAKRLAYLRQRALRDEFFASRINTSITDEMLRARYDAEIAKLQSPEEVRARHILVESEAEALDIIRQLNEGADFAALATEKSTDPGSAPNGGDLGFFSRGRMIPEFEQAAFALEPGTFSQAPVQSQFGWHVIKVEERRMQPPPPYEVVAAQLRQLLLQEAYVAEVGKLRDAAEISVVGGETTPPAPPAEVTPAPEAPAEAAPAPAPDVPAEAPAEAPAEIPPAEPAR